MNQKAWLEYELQQIAIREGYAESDKDYFTGYRDALTNALNNLNGMTTEEPELASFYLPAEIKNQTLNPSTLRVLAMELEEQGITGMNVALVLDLIVGR